MKTRTNTVLEEDKSLPGIGTLKNSFGIERPFVDIFKKKNITKMASNIIFEMMRECFKILGRFSSSIAMVLPE